MRSFVTVYTRIRFIADLARCADARDQPLQLAQLPMPADGARLLMEVHVDLVCLAAQ